MTTKFAILARVSTTGQEREGVSLEVQRTVLAGCVKTLGGTLIKEYVGSESATAGEDKERPMLDEALSDVKSGLIDALMVYDLSRLTRDPISSGLIRADLKKYRVKLYVQSQEYNLDNDDTTFFIDLMAVINARNARIQTKKSIESKITLAKRGWQVVGSGPFGRKLAHNDHSKDAEWVLIDADFMLAQRIYDLYVNQRYYVDKIARMVGKSGGMVYKILNDKARLIQTFQTNDGKLEIITPVPAFYTAAQQAQIKARLKSNRKVSKRKNDYLLAGLVKCEYCQLTYQGVYANNGANPYYRHSHHRRTEKCVKFISKPAIEEVVIEHISEIVKNNDTLIDAIHKSNSVSVARQKQLTEEIAELEKEQETQSKRKARIIKLIVDEVLTSDDAANELDKTKSALETLHLELVSKRNEFESLSASTDVPTEILSRITQTIDALRQHHGQSIHLWKYDIQRLLVEWFFGISDKNGVFIGAELTYSIKSSLGTLGFGIIGEDCDFGVTGLKHDLTPDTISHFSSLFNNIDINPIAGPS
ncbi:MAG: recombinase family protein [Candidatus Competibacter sp.]